jgi:hypothetical protein
MTRQEANLEILRLIHEYVEAYPDQRFSQILQNMDVIVTLQDEYYMESEELLKRVAKSVL